MKAKVAPLAGPGEQAALAKCLRLIAATIARRRGLDLGRMTIQFRLKGGATAVVKIPAGSDYAENDKTRIFNGLKSCSLRKKLKVRLELILHKDRRKGD